MWAQASTTTAQGLMPHAGHAGHTLETGAGTGTNSKYRWLYNFSTRQRWLLIKCIVVEVACTSVASSNRWCSQHDLPTMAGNAR